jgi:glycosyltransferase involved in cell wall biosynthesis
LKPEGREEPSLKYHASVPDLICLSHLRWNFVFQRPQHLMVRFARERRVFYVEEPITDAETPWLDVSISHGVHVVVPHLPPGLSPTASLRAQRQLLGAMIEARRVEQPLVWLYTPLALPLVDGLQVSAIVYDCMDELSGFAGASPELRDRERDLLARADVVFTGGHSLFEAKREHHPNVHAFPSSVDVAHFRRARTWRREPSDQRIIARPRIGFCGVIDERMDLDLVRQLAEARPDWQLVLIGPTAKIDDASLPRGANLHYLGMKSYDVLPHYLAGWDAAILPFAHNPATRFISPTKTPEYLAAGCPVVSTSIRDVVRPYGERGLVHIADTVEDFSAAIAAALTPAGRAAVQRADALLATMSWDRTWSAMNTLVGAVERRGAGALASARASTAVAVQADAAAI